MDLGATCSRCGRDAPRQLDGNAGDPDWSAWEVSATADGPDGEPAVVCPGCQTEKGAIRVLVRICDEDRIEECRELRFALPDDLSQSELLEAGFAIDHNSATKSVTSYAADQFVPLSEALHDEQVALVRWLGERGYQVEFK